MFKKVLNLYVVLLLSFLFTSACEKIIVNNDENTDDHDDPADYTWDTTAVAQIKLNGNSITVEPASAVISGSKVTIKTAGTYNITGTLTDGQIVVDSKGDGNIRLILNGVNIKNSTGAPIFISDADKTIIILAENTENVLTDGTSYITVDGEPNAAIFSNSDLTLYGEGSLAITANYKDGISSDDGLLIKSGTINITAADDGIRGKDYLIIKGGKIVVSSKGDGLKSDNIEDITLGYVTVEYADIILTSGGDAITAATDVRITDGIFTIKSGGGTTGTYTTSAKGIKAVNKLNIDKGTFNFNCADDALHSNNKVIINDGIYNIATKDDAIHADASVEINNGTINITQSYEGIESASITVNSGNVSLLATDDGFNATKGSRTEANDGSSLNLNGGYIVVNCSSGDGLDSNGNLTMTGGTVIVHGPKSQPEVGFDVNGTFNISGGLLIATGPNSGNMIETPSTSSTQYSVKATIQSNLTTSTLFHIEDANGNDLVTYKPVRNVYYIVFSSSGLKSGSSYSIYTGGSSTGTFNNGLYTGGTYTGGTLKKTFTISGKVTNVSF